MSAPATFPAEFPHPRRRVSRHVRADGMLAMIDHRLRGAAAPVNPYRPGTKFWMMFDWGVDQADRFCAPVRDYAR